jgi:predicted HTH transcriptional regulator
MNILDKVRQPENRKLELKRSLPPGAKWLKTIISFANGAGGELILGVDDKSRGILGIENPFELEEKISNTIHDSIRPSISPYIQKPCPHFSRGRLYGRAWKRNFKNDSGDEEFRQSKAGI